MITLSPRDRRARRKAREGFSLIEIMVALTLLALVLSSLARLTTIVAVRARGNDVYAKRSAVLQMEANKFGATPLSTLNAWSTTDQTFTVNGFTYTRKLTIVKSSSSQDSIKIVIVPATSGVASDSAIIIRSKPSTATVLCKTC
jgi:prepilin-type N-terminal cleavage/methylation domain-containing protein